MRPGRVSETNFCEGVRQELAIRCSIWRTALQSGSDFPILSHSQAANHKTHGECCQHLASLPPLVSRAMPTRSYQSDEKNMDSSKESSISSVKIESNLHDEEFERKTMSDTLSRYACTRLTVSLAAKSTSESCPFSRCSSPLRSSTAQTWARPMPRVWVQISYVHQQAISNPQNSQQRAGPRSWRTLQHHHTHFLRSLCYTVSCGPRPWSDDRLTQFPQRATRKHYPSEGWRS